MVWTQPDDFRVLPNLAGDDYSEAYGINDQGEVVGRGFGASSEGRLWKDGRVHDLNDLAADPGYRIFSGVDINDRGQILADALDLSGPSPVPVSLILTPR